MVNIKTPTGTQQSLNSSQQSNLALSSTNHYSVSQTNTNRPVLTRTASTPSSTTASSNKQSSNSSSSSSSSNNNNSIQKKSFSGEKASNSSMSKQNFATNNNHNNNSYQNQHHHLQQQQQTQYYGSNNASYNNSLYQPQQSPKSNFNLNNNQRLTNTNGTNNNSSFPAGQQQQHHRNNSISTLMNVNSNSTNNMNNANTSRSNYNNTNTNSFHSNHHQLHHHNSMQNIYLNNHFNGNNNNNNIQNNSNYNNGYHTNSMTFNQVPSQQQQHHIYQKQISLPANVNISRQSHHYHHHQQQQPHQHHQQQQQSPPQLVNQKQQQQSLNYSSTSSSSSSSISTHSPTSPTSSPSSSITFTKPNKTPPRLIEVKHHQIASQSLVNEEKQVALPLMSPKIELEIIDETKALLLNSNNDEDYDDGGKEIVLDEEDEVVFEDDDEVNEQSPARLADLIPSERDFGENKLEYFRHVILAVDRLYPDTKWPLHNTWTFWHIKNDPNQSWEANIKEVVDVSYVEDFWSVANYLYTPTNMLSHGGDITFFKKNIRPMWEDAQNKTGGSWLHTIHQYKKYPEIYDYWLETLMALIGDNFCGTGAGRSEQPTVANEHLCDFISGVYASPRSKQHKLALWTQNYKDEKTTRLIGKIWKEIMNINENITITFEVINTANLSKMHYFSMSLKQ